MYARGYFHIRAKIINVTFITQNDTVWPSDVRLENNSVVEKIEIKTQLKEAQ